MSGEVSGGHDSLMCSKSCGWENMGQGDGTLGAAVGNEAKGTCSTNPCLNCGYWSQEFGEIKILRNNYPRTEVFQATKVLPWYNDGTTKRMIRTSHQRGTNECNSDIFYQLCSVKKEIGFLDQILTLNFSTIWACTSSCFRNDRFYIKEAIYSDYIRFSDIS